MGGSGGGGGFISRSLEETRAMVRKAESKTSDASFQTELASELGSLLGEFNGRDVDATRERLSDLKQTLEGSIDGTIDQMLGGSVAKHTYVDGLSDIDSLIFINDTSYHGNTPSEVLDHMTETIKESIGDGAVVYHGKMAVTVEYKDGMVMQLLPAIKDEDGHVHVPSSRREGWSKINPITFQEALTRRNQECGGKLVPTVKLAKAIVGLLPDSQKIAGYHMESLAISAFKNYDGTKTTASMLPIFFERASQLVLSPIRDSTGQSVHVDEYLGASGSDARQSASHVLGRIARRMQNATAAESLAQWRALFGLD